METFNRTVPAATSPERKFRRFNLNYPVLLRFPKGKSFLEIQATSRNVSIGGLLVDSSSPIPGDASVSFTIKVEGGRVLRPVHLTGEGLVVRVEKNAKARKFTVAVQCNQPIAHLEEWLPAGKAARTEN